MSDVETRIEHKIDLILEKLGITATPNTDGNGDDNGHVDGHGPSTALPGDVVDISGWKLGVCLPRSDNPSLAQEIGQPKLDHYRERDHFFVTDDGTGIVLRAHHGHPTTKGSHNPRTELRELTDGWNATSGTHRLTVEGQLNRQTAVRKHVVLAQIHDAHDDVTVFRVEDRKLWITDGNTTHGHLVTDQFSLGARYTLTIEVDDGVVSYWYNGDKVDFTLKYKGSDNYFKAGNYLQSNDESAPGETDGAFSEVVIYELEVSHS